MCTRCHVRTIVLTFSGTPRCFRRLTATRGIGRSPWRTRTGIRPDEQGAFQRVIRKRPAWGLLVADAPYGTVDTIRPPKLLRATTTTPEGTTPPPHSVITTPPSRVNRWPTKVRPTRDRVDRVGAAPPAPRGRRRGRGDAAASGWPHRRPRRPREGEPRGCCADRPTGATRPSDGAEPRGGRGPIGRLSRQETPRCG